MFCLVRNLTRNSKVYIFIFCASICALLVIYFANIWTIRDHITPSSEYDLKINTINEDDNLNIVYKWTGYKEASTLEEYIIVQYDPNFIELENHINNEVSFIKNLNQILPALGGDALDYSQDKTQLIIPLERTKKSDSIILSIVEKKASEPIIEVYYIHMVNLPMDSITGWIKKVICKVEDVY